MHMLESQENMGMLGMEKSSMVKLALYQSYCMRYFSAEYPVELNAASLHIVGYCTADIQVDYRVQA
jgi:hypothetical protein